MQLLELILNTTISRNKRLLSLFVDFLDNGWSEQFQYVRGKKDSNLVLDKRGFVYRRESQLNNKFGQVRWGCQKRSSLRCRAKIIIVGDRIVSLRNEHNHMAE